MFANFEMTGELPGWHELPMEVLPEHEDLICGDCGKSLCEPTYTDTRQLEKNMRTEI